jgi:hypothetical protein
MAPPLDLGLDTTAPRVEPDAAWLASLPWLKGQAASSKPTWLNTRSDAQPAVEPEVLIQAEPGSHEDDPELAEDCLAGETIQEPQQPAAEVNNVTAPQRFEVKRAPSAPSYRQIKYDDLNDLMPDIARRVLGPENASLSTHEQLCWGNYGSIKVENDSPKKGKWYDHEADTGGGWLQLLLHKGVVSSPAAAYEWLKSEFSVEVENDRGAKRIVATYDYHDEDGRLLFQKVRLEPKSFYQRRPDGVGGWINEIKGVRRVLYNLPELRARPNETIYFVEGEKDVISGAKLGLLTTCNPEGGSKDAHRQARKVASRVQRNVARSRRRHRP